MLQILLLGAPMIGKGDVELVATDTLGGLSDLYGKWLGLEVLAEEDDTSIGGPETRT